MATPQDPAIPLIQDLTEKRAWRFYNPATDALPGGSGLPNASQIGQVLFSIDGSTFTPELPVTGPYGWLVNEDGILLVSG